MSGKDPVARPAHSGAATRTLGFAVLLTGSSGFLDAYTYLERGGVFANAQTANVVLGAIAVVEGRWLQAGQHLLTISTFAVAGRSAGSRLRHSRISRSSAAGTSAWCDGGSGSRRSTASIQLAVS